MTRLHTQTMTDQYDVPETKDIGISYSPDHTRFVPGWYILPVFLFGSMIWFFILRMAWRFFS